MPAVDDQVLLPNRTAVEPALEDLAGACRVTGLRGEARARRVRRHSVVRHRPPGVILRRRLREPDVARVAGELPALTRRRYRVAIADLPARRVYEVGSALHATDHVGVEEMLGLRMERRVDRDDVAHRDELFRSLVKGDAELLLDVR